MGCRVEGLWVLGLSASGLAVVSETKPKNLTCFSWVKGLGLRALNPKP